MICQSSVTIFGSMHQAPRHFNETKMEAKRTGETSDPNGDRRDTSEQPPLQSPLMAEERRKKRLTVMVAVDESDVSLYALKWTLENLFNKPAASASPIPATGEETPVVEPDPEEGMITIVHVMQPFERYTFPAEPSMYASSAMVELVRKAQRQNATGLLSRALKICKETKIKAETLILEGNPKEAICKAVEQMHFDLLVVGSRGLGTIKRAFLGSISDFCAHHAQCPILIVKPPHK